MLGVAIRNPRFRLLWTAQIVSQAGDWLNRVACLVLIGDLGGSVGVGALYGVELGLRLLPSALLGPLAGPVADRLPRRTSMIVADVVRAAIVVGLLLVRERSDLWLLYALIVAQMGVGVFFDAARSAALPDTVARDDLQSAHALSSVTWSAMLGLGALAGGMLVDSIGVYGVFVVDAASYVASAIVLARLALPPVPPQTEPFRWRDVVVLADLRRALAHARSLGLGPVLAAKTFWGAAGGFLVLLPLAAHERFGGELAPASVAAVETGTAVGLLYAARGVGTGFGPVLARALLGRGDRDLLRQVSLGFLVAALGYAAFGFAGRLDLACACVAFAHLGGSALWVASTVVWQRHVSDAFRGRVFALEFLGMNLSFAAGGVLAGALYDATGSFEGTVWAVSALVLALGAAWARLARGVLAERVRVPVEDRGA